MSLPAPGTLLRVIRWPNLVIIALTQYTVAIFLSPPSVARSSALDFFALTALIGATVSIAAAGYVMNDILDQTNDRINKPTQIMIGSEVSTTAGWWLYGILTAAGLLLIVIAAWRFGQAEWIIVHPAVTVILMLYSMVFKGLPLVGNVVVALCCTAVPSLSLLAIGWNPFHILLSFKNGQPQELVALGFLLFSWTTTMYREGVKDLEDMAGDRASGLRTLPIAAGRRVAVGQALIWGLLTLILLQAAGQMEWARQKTALVIFIQAAVTAPQVWSMVLLIRSRDQMGYRKVSLVSKLVMVTGLMYLGLAAFATI